MVLDHQETGISSTAFNSLCCVASLDAWLNALRTVFFSLAPLLYFLSIYKPIPTNIKAIPINGIIIF